MRPPKKWFAVAVICASAAVLAAQDSAPPPADQSQQNAPLETPDQLDTLVAPIALYPDSLLSQILAASTYPLEIAELSQWLPQNRGLSGDALMNAARDQGWDPSVTALAAFPEVVNNLARDIRWTTELGNAFLAQQGDVMAAVQRMRAQAQAAGKLQSNAQENVETETQDGQTAIEIVPTNPQVIYVPEYNPAWVWGAPVIGYYPPVWYPGVSFGFGWGGGIFINTFFGGCCGWGGFGWGWQPHWYDHQIYVNNYFFHRYGFYDYHEGGGWGFHGAGVWQHDPMHRLGVPYANHEVANRFRGAGGFNRGLAGNGRSFAGGFNRGLAGNGRSFAGGNNFNRGGFNRTGFNGGGFNRGAERPVETPRSFGGGNAGRGGLGGTVERAPTQRFGSQGFERGNPGASHSVFGGVHNGGFTRVQSDHGFSSMRSSFGGGGFHGGGSRGGGGGFHGGGGGAHGGGGRR
jgi:hypothetical protein